MMFFSLMQQGYRYFQMANENAQNMSCFGFLFDNRMILQFFQIHYMCHTICQILLT